MPSPFPGMDPYLENPRGFPNFHHGLLSEIRADLNRLLRPKYVARIGERVMFPESDDTGEELFLPDHLFRQSLAHIDLTASENPIVLREVSDFQEPIIAMSHIDDEIREYYLQILEVTTKDVVTVIEVIRPTNKCRGAASRHAYMATRHEVLCSPTHYVEIDLLRDGKPTFDRNRLPAHQYAIHISRSEVRPQSELWPIALRQRLPIIRIPLRKGDADVPLDLQAAFSQEYENGAFDLIAEYEKPPTPPLPPELQAWAATMIQKQMFGGVE